MKTNNTTELIDQLSKEFSRLVNEYYTPDQLSEVRAKNAASNDSSCATHDYYDSNMIMDEAFKTVTKRDYVFYDEDIPGSEEQNAEDTDLVNAAWSKSKAAQFVI